MPKQITISDLKILSLSLSIDEIDGEEAVTLGLRYERLDEAGNAVPGYQGFISALLEQGMKQKALNFVKNSVKPFLREKEGLG